MSPRGALLWMGAAKAFAVMNGRDYLLPDDLKRSAVPSLAHRLSVLAARDTADISEAQDQVVRQVVSSVPVPR